MNVKKELVEKIKRLRKKRKLTQEELAEMINISPRNLSGIEVGANFIKADTLEKILVALDTTTEELFANNHLQDSDSLIKNMINDIKSVKENRLKLESLYRIIKSIVNL